MDTSKFVYDSIVKEAKKAGSTETIARRYAGIGQGMFKKSAFGHKSVGKMIEQMIKDAVKDSKLIGKKSSGTAFAPKPSKPVKQIKKKAKVKAAVKVKRGVSDCGLWSKKI